LVSQIVSFIQEGNHPNLKPLTNGLLTVDNKVGYPSWMHNKISDGLYLAPRTGCLVEVNAFWYNALKFNEEIARNQDNPKLERKMALLAEITKTSFLEVFLNDGGYLYDYV
jgi:Amylo-alpha-1,6-glucosidase.